MKGSSKIKSDSFSFSIPNLDSDEADLIFGESYFKKGDQISEILPESIDENWAIDIENVKFDDKIVKSELKNVKIIFDLEQEDMYMPDYIYKNLKESFEEAHLHCTSYDHCTSNSFVKVDSFPNITL